MLNKRSFSDEAPETPAKRQKPAPPAHQRLDPNEAFHRNRAHIRQQTQTNAHSGSSEASSLPAPTGVFKAPNQTPKRIVFGDDESSETAPPQPASLRKSVSFTPDTKAQDGYSASNFFKAWAGDKSATENSASEQPEAQPPSPSEQPKKDDKRKKKKKQKKAKKSTKTAAEGAETVTKSVPDYVEYLLQYQRDKDNWKFNKNKQNDLFRNLFNISRIPSEHTPAVVQYIKGLKGQARQRIAEQAEDVLKAIWVSENEGADAMSLGSAAARRRAYYEALKSSFERYEASGAGRTQYGDEKLKEMAQEYERGKRAEAILSEALDNVLFAEPEPTPVIPTASTSNSTTPANIPRATRVVETNTKGTALAEAENRKRKRKARTEVSSPSESSSSSSSEGESESDSSSDTSSDESESESDSDSPQPRKPSPPKKAKTADPANPFDDSFLDKKFGKATSQTYNSTAPKPKAHS
ncbi:uncharacterized protein MYCFIDRAFT_81712 [Pseudocercospora fijiensis CIRAD86]|uniref:WKF domain-containing protein n=1 Tax=Pseudocercospora fijiensis (strain CIRAD86) TaxID=383855 RepID=M3B1Y2_PSEFD|nr:uncharacterized protein MYCFIDRAFT_81712 [Pseudocercospora fijiensis CIRAD86]EME83422.1 hypothetical protein MYCFIDRAFT_81712 [Pseudocercospora fijiensis CIRAD86]